MHISVGRCFESERLIISPRRKLLIPSQVSTHHGVAVSKSGEVVVSDNSHCISVYSWEGKKIRSFGSSEGSSTGQFPLSLWCT